MSTGDALLDPEIVRIMNGRGSPDLKELRALVVRAYNRENQGNADPHDPSDDDRAAIARWLNRAHMENPNAVLFGAPPLIRQFLFSGIESKVSWLIQAPCVTCGPHRTFPAVQFGIQVSPTSQQSLSTRYRHAFRKAVAAAMSRGHFARYDSEDLCVRIVYVLEARRRAKLDVDNLTKGTLDALKGIAFNDDSQIVHLDLLKVRCPNDEWISVNIWPTTVGEHQIDTFRQTIEIVHNGERLTLDDFLDAEDVGGEHSDKPTSEV